MRMPDPDSKPSAMVTSDLEHCNPHIVSRKPLQAATSQTTNSERPRRAIRRHTEKETDGWTDRQTDRPTDPPADGHKQTDRQDKTRQDETRRDETRREKTGRQTDHACV